MKRAALIAYLLAVHAVLALAILRPGTVRHYTGLPNLHVQKMQSVLRYRDATVPDGSAIFLGDSITERLAVAVIEPDAVNFGISGATTADVADLAGSLQSLRRARVIYLLVGANDLRRRVPDYAALLRALPGDVPLVWSGVMPSDKFDPAAANARIRALCASRPLCRYVDTSTMQPQEFADGLHPNTGGYRKWAALLGNLVRPSDPDIAGALNVLAANLDGSATDH